MHDFEGAIADYNQAIKLKPDNGDFYLGRGAARYSFGDRKSMYQAQNIK